MSQVRAAYEEVEEWNLSAAFSSLLLLSLFRYISELFELLNSFAQFLYLGTYSKAATLFGHSPVYCTLHQVENVREEAKMNLAERGAKNQLCEMATRWPHG